MKLFIIPGCIILLLSCHHSGLPDVSNIQVNLKVQRFEKDFFSIDTNKILQEIERLRPAYPSFINIFMNQILGFTNRSSPDSVKKYVQLFIRDYRFVKDSSDLKFGAFNEPVREIKQAFQFVKYYFPEYTLPPKIITFIGPFDGYSDALTNDAISVGLQLHLGKNFSFYQSDFGRELFPDYIAQRFEPENIAVNAIKNIIDDLFPEKSTGKPLIEQMIEKGKRLYLMDRFLPTTPAHFKINYSEKQLTDCYEKEAIIWNFFLTNNLLNLTEQNVIKNYIGDSPKTQELGEGAPGGIGAFSGWQIVNKYMSKYPSIKLKQLMEMDNREIYTLSKYKP